METLARSANRGSVSTGYDIDNSLKFEPDNGEYMYRTNVSGTNRKTFTVSVWTKRTEMSAPIHTYTGSHPYQNIWRGGTNSEATLLGWWGGTPKDALWVDIGGGTGNTGADYRSYSAAVFRDTSAWYHIVLAVDTTQATASNRLKVWVNNEQITTWTTQSIPAQDFQCALESGQQMTLGGYSSSVQNLAAYLAEFNYLDGVTATPTDFGEYDSDSGIWKPKAYSGSYGTNGCYLNYKTLGFGTSHRYWKYQAYSTTNHVPRASRIYLIKEDGTTENFKYYAADNCSDSGGIMDVATGSTTYYDDSNTEYTIDLGTAENVQGFGFYGVYDTVSKNVTAKLYYSDNGTSWTEDESHTFNTSYCGTYNHYRGTAGLGQDDSGNGNHFTLNNITSADQATDTPTNLFTTFNDKYHYQNTQVAAEAVVNNGATTWETTRATWWRTGYSNNGVSNGKWYAEFSANTTTFMVGVGSIDRIDGTVDSGPNTHLGASNTAAIGFYAANGNLYENGTTTTNWFSGANSNDILSLALDMDNGYVYLAVNGTWVNSGDPTSGSSGTGGIALTYPSDAYYMGVSLYGVNECKGNWGGYTEISIASGNADADGYGNFEYAPPSGYYAWCTKNLAEYG